MVAGFDVERNPLPAVFRFRIAGGQDRPLLRLLFRAVGNDDSADLLFAFREDNTAQGMKTGTNEISKVAISLRK